MRLTVIKHTDKFGKEGKEVQRCVLQVSAGVFGTKLSGLEKIRKYMKAAGHGRLQKDTRPK